MCENAMKKTLLLCAVCFALLFCACGEETAPVTTKPSEKITETVQTAYSAAEILGRMIKAASPKEAMTTLTPEDEDYEDSFDFLFEYDISLTADSAVCYCTSGRLADEIDVFVLKDASDADQLTSALKKRALSRASAYKGYYDAESEKAKEALVLTEGRYVVFAISDNNGDVKKAFELMF